VLQWFTRSAIETWILNTLGRRREDALHTARIACLCLSTFSVGGDCPPVAKTSTVVPVSKNAPSSKDRANFGKPSDYRISIILARLHETQDVRAES